MSELQPQHFQFVANITFLKKWLLFSFCVFDITELIILLLFCYCCSCSNGSYFINDTCSLCVSIFTAAK